MKNYYLILFSCIIVLNCKCQSNQDIGRSNTGSNQLTDADGNIYKTVKIGKQVWMAENLNVSHFRNGDPIPEAEDSVVWQESNREEKPVWCYYNEDTAKGNKYHKLYNWYAVNDLRGLAPAGWHIPSDSEWNEAITYLGGELKAGAIMKTNIKNDTANQNSFNGLFGGYRFDFGTFMDFGFKTGFWSSTETGSANASIRYLVSYANLMASSSRKKGAGFSVRCIRN
jgi:uncharacterized protein (TIGR02145 family)